MGGNTLSLVVLYTTGSSARFRVGSYKEGQEVLQMEGDHVIDWYWEGQTDG